MNHNSSCGCKKQTCKSCNDPCREPVVGTPCSPPVTPCIPCTETVNTDCIIYNDTPFSFEASNIRLGDPRVLTTLLKTILSQTSPAIVKEVRFNKERPTKVILNSYAILPGDSLIVYSGESTNGGLGATYNFILPGALGGVDSESFKGKTIKFVDTSLGVLNTYTFTTPVKAAYAPAVLSHVNLDSLKAIVGHPTSFSIAFLPNAAGVYEWMLV